MQTGFKNRLCEISGCFSRSLGNSPSLSYVGCDVTSGLDHERQFCGNTAEEGVDVHFFPKTKKIQEQWIKFVKVKRADFIAPSLKYSVFQTLWRIISQSCRDLGLTEGLMQDWGKMQIHCAQKLVKLKGSDIGQKFWVGQDPLKFG